MKYLRWLWRNVRNIVTGRYRQVEHVCTYCGDPPKHEFWHTDYEFSAFGISDGNGPILYSCDDSVCLKQAHARKSLHKDIYSYPRLTA